MPPPTNNAEFASSPSDREKLSAADLVLVHGKIWTGEIASNRVSKTSVSKFAEAAAIANGRFVAVGNSAEVELHIGPNTRVIDLKGRLALPGFIDSHAHLIYGGFQLLCRLEGRRERG